MRAYLKITDRSGNPMFDSDEGYSKPLWVIERDMLEKHGNSIFLFRATPSEPVNSPLRKASPRKFVMGD